jgi:hypothetical protein
MGTYTTEVATPRDAQRVFDAHPISSGDGRCLTCRVEGPCGLRRAALIVLSAAGALPRRQPGATRPALVGLRRIA